MSTQPSAPGAAGPDSAPETSTGGEALRDRRVLYGLIGVVAVLLVLAAVLLVPKLLKSSSSTAPAAASHPATTTAHTNPVAVAGKKTHHAVVVVPPLYTGAVGTDPFAAPIQPQASPSASASSSSTAGSTASTSSTGTASSGTAGASSPTKGTGTSSGTHSSDYVSNGYLSVIYNGLQPSCPAVVKVEVSAGEDALDVAKTDGRPHYQRNTKSGAGTSTCTWVYTATFAKGHPVYTFTTVVTTGKALETSQTPVNASDVSTGPDLFASVGL